MRTPHTQVGASLRTNATAIAKGRGSGHGVELALMSARIRVSDCVERGHSRECPAEAATDEATAAKDRRTK